MRCSAKPWLDSRSRRLGVDPGVSGSDGGDSSSDDDEEGREAEGREETTYGLLEGLSKGEGRVLERDDRGG